MKNTYKDFKDLGNIYSENVRGHGIDDVINENYDENEFDVVATIEDPVNDVPTDVEVDTGMEQPNLEPHNNVKLTPEGEESVRNHLSELATELVDAGLVSPDDAEFAARESYDKFIDILKKGVK